MRHRKGPRKLNRTSSHRKAMFANMSTARANRDDVAQGKRAAEHR